MKKIVLVVACSIGVLACSFRALALPDVRSVPHFLSQSTPTQAIELLVWSLAAIAVAYLVIVAAIASAAHAVGAKAIARQIAMFLPASLRFGILSAVFTVASPLTAFASPSPQFASPPPTLELRVAIPFSTTDEPLNDTQSSSNDITMKRVATAEKPRPVSNDDDIVMHVERPPSTTHQAANELPQAVPQTPAEPHTKSTWSVRPGDNFWKIAQTQVNDHLGHHASESDVAPYWLKLISANASKFVDPGNPDLLIPGQVLDLPIFATP